MVLEFALIFGQALVFNQHFQGESLRGPEFIQNILPWSTQRGCNLPSLEHLADREWGLVHALEVTFRLCFASRALDSSGSSTGF